MVWELLCSQMSHLKIEPVSGQNGAATPCKRLRYRAPHPNLLYLIGRRALHKEFSGKLKPTVTLNDGCRYVLHEARDTNIIPHLYDKLLKSFEQM